MTWSSAVSRVVVDVVDVVITSDAIDSLLHSPAPETTSRNDMPAPPYGRILMEISLESVREIIGFGPLIFLVESARVVECLFAVVVVVVGFKVVVVLIVVILVVVVVVVLVVVVVFFAVVVAVLVVVPIVVELHVVVLSIFSVVTVVVPPNICDAVTFLPLPFFALCFLCLPAISTLVVVVVVTDSFRFIASLDVVKYSIGSFSDCLLAISGRPSTGPNSFNLAS